MTITNAPYRTPTTYQQQVVTFQPAQYIEAPELNAFTSFLEDFSPAMKSLGKILSENRKRREEKDHRTLLGLQIEKRTAGIGGTPGIFTGLLEPTGDNPVATRPQRDTNNAWTSIKAKDPTALSPSIANNELEFFNDRVKQVANRTAEIEGIDDLSQADWQDPDTINATLNYLIADVDAIYALNPNEKIDAVDRMSQYSAKLITALQDEQAAQNKLIRLNSANAATRNVQKAMFGSLEDQRNLPLLINSMHDAYGQQPPDSQAAMRKFFTDNFIEEAALAESIGGDDQALDDVERRLDANQEIFPGWTIQDMLQEQGISHYAYKAKIRERQEEVNKAEDTIAGRARADAVEEIFDTKITPLLEGDSAYLLANDGVVDEMIKGALTDEFLKRHGIPLQDVPALTDEIKKKIQPYDDDKAILTRTQIRLLKDESPDIIEAQLDNYFALGQITEETYSRGLKLVEAERGKRREIAAQLTEQQKLRLSIVKESRDTLINDLEQRALVTIVDDKTGKPLYSTVNELPYEVRIDIIGEVNSTLLDAAMLPISSHQEWVGASGEVLKKTSLTGFEQYNKPDYNEITRKDDLRVALDTGDILSMEDAIELVNDVSAGVIPEKWLDQIKDAYENDVDDETVSRVLANLVVRANQMVQGYNRATSRE